MVLSQDLHNNDLDDVPTDSHDHVVGGHGDAGCQYFDVDSVDVVGDDEDDHNGWDQLATGGVIRAS